MIFPEECKVVGSGLDKERTGMVYFLTRYLIREGDGGLQVVEVTTDPNATGLMRRVTGERVLAGGRDVCIHPEKVQLHDRAGLVRLARGSGCRCTVFTGLDEHVTFVLDPDPSLFLTVHVYDLEPPRPSLSACIRELEAAGLFGELSVAFEHHVRDIREMAADVYPCRAGGLSPTLDADPMRGGERIAGCRTGSQLYAERYGDDFTLVEICPLQAVEREPFIARCCRKEREGVGVFSGRMGAVVHWGASPRRICESVVRLVEQWRAANGTGSARCSGCP